MPLRPALAAFHPKAPAPKTVRSVHCPHCGTGFEISSKAMSVRCPSCTRPLAFEDLNLNSRVEGDVSTMGHVQLGEQGAMVGRLVCGQLTNVGRLEGRVVVFGRIELCPQSLTTGEISGRSLSAGIGCTLRARASIGPKPQVSAIARTIGSRPLRRSGGRRMVGVGENARAFAPAGV
ncbi:MAG: polymer-forming cytoskeletal protein [Planctomycetota bacterium]